MKKKKIEKAHELLRELEELERVRKWKQYGKYSHPIHFEIARNYLKESQGDIIIIPSRYNDKLIGVVNKIIEEIKREIEKL